MQDYGAGAPATLAHARAPLHGWLAAGAGAGGGLIICARCRSGSCLLLR